MHVHRQPGFQTKAHSGIPLAICSAYLTEVLGTINPCISWPKKVCFPKLPFRVLNLFPKQAAVPDPSPHLGVGGGGECLRSVNLIPLVCIYSP